jgi:hypothetical protein
MKSEVPSGWCWVKAHGIEATSTLDTADDAGLALAGRC